MSNLPLFVQPLWPGRPKLAENLAELARSDILFGTSSWKYEGWMGQIYTPERYFTRGRFSRKLFEETCLAEYAEVFPAVCGDFSFYQFPSEQYWRRLFAGAPESLTFAFKVPEEITVKHWPGHVRYGARAGAKNESFLNAALLEQALVRPLEAYRRRIGVLIFEFGTFSKKAYETPESFLDELAPFLRALPEGWRYAVEVRNAEFLCPDYFGLLRLHRIAHVFNAWTRMPPLGTQIGMPGAWTADFAVVRALLRVGRPYEEAVRRFEPYAHVQEENPKAREAIREIVRRALTEKRGAFVFVNNRLEGNAPGTIEGIIDGLD